MNGYHFSALKDWTKEYPKVCFTNNDRKLHGLPMRRKADKRKRVYTRNKADEDFNAFYDTFWK